MEEVLSAPLTCAPKDLQQHPPDERKSSSPSPACLALASQPATALSHTPLKSFAHVPYRETLSDSYEIYLVKHKLQQEMNQELERYLSILNHDIKTPVLAQMHALECVLSKNVNNFTPTQRTLLEMTIESCQQQYQIINNLITTIKYKQDSIILNKSWFNLCDLLHELVKSLKTEDKRITIDNIHSKLNIKADRENFSNAIYTILKNALDKSVFAGEIRISLTELDNGKSSSPSPACLALASQPATALSNTPLKSFAHVPYRETLSDGKQISITVAWQESSKLCGFTYQGEGKQVYINGDNYNTVGSSLEIELALEILKRHGGEINSAQSGNIKSMEIKLPIKM